MQTTKNYGLKKPEATDFYDVNDFNDNMDIIDEKLKDTKTIGDMLTASDNTPFRFGVTDDGQYGYIITNEAGADTVIPFSNAKKLYEALKYSGLVTEDMSFNEMCEVLAQEYPEYIEFDVLTLTQDDWSVVASGGTGSDSFEVIQNESIVISAASYHYQNAARTNTATTKNTYDLSEFKKLQIKGTATWVISGQCSAFVRNANVIIRDADSSIDLVKYEADLIQTETYKWTANMDTVIDLPDLTDINCELLIQVTGYGNNYTGTTTMTLNTFKFYTINEVG